MVEKTKRRPYGVYLASYKGKGGPGSLSLRVTRSYRKGELMAPGAAASLTGAKVSTAQSWMLGYRSPPLPALRKIINHLKKEGIDPLWALNELADRYEKNHS